VISIVPQGTVLGHTLFLVYINEFARRYLILNSAIELFADDSILYKANHTSHMDAETLKEDLVNEI